MYRVDSCALFVEKLGAALLILHPWLGVTVACVWVSLTDEVGARHHLGVLSYPCSVEK